MRHPRINFDTQNGVVLLISMIMLLLLSLIGVSGLQVTSLEEKMAGNAKDTNLAFQNAETTLRYVEKKLKTTLPVFDDTNGYYNYKPNKEPWVGIDWTSNSATIEYLISLGGVSETKQPRYIVEEITGDPGVDLSNPIPTKYYRITTHAVGTTNSSTVELQSIFKR